MASSGLYLSLDKQFWPWDWAWVQSAQGSYQLGKTVKMTTFMGLVANSNIEALFEDYRILAHITRSSI